MRALKYLASCVAFALILCAGSFAKDSNSGNFVLQQAAQLGSTVLQPGHYTAEWSGPKDAVKINILQHGKTVATAEGKLKDLPTKSPYAAVTLKNQTNNNPRVDEIDFNNRSEALVVRGI
jgi:hypothetical protein